MHPGEFYFGDRHTRIRTLLGSCVSIILWHPRLLIGGMSHFMLPARGARSKDSGGLDGRYAEEAMQLFLRELRAGKTRPSEYQVKLFGGGSMFPDATKSAGASDISGENIEIGRALVKRHGFRIAVEDLGGTGHRQVIFDLWSGNVWVRQHKEVLSRR